MSEINLRRAIPEDVEVIHSLAERIWRQHYISIIGEAQVNYMLGKMYSLDALRSQIQNGTHEFYLITENQNPIGFIAWENKNEQDAFIHKFYILNEKQRSGLGSVAFKRFLELYPGTETIRLQVNRINFTAINFYFKMGFTIESVADFDIGDGYFMNDFIMICKTIKPQISTSLTS
jgi:predicted acetyltransferase